MFRKWLGRSYEKETDKKNGNWILDAEGGYRILEVGYWNLDIGIWNFEVEINSVVDV